MQFKCYCQYAFYMCALRLIRMSSAIDSVNVSRLSFTSKFTLKPRPFYFQFVAGAIIAPHTAGHTGGAGSIIRNCTPSSRPDYCSDTLPFHSPVPYGVLGMLLSVVVWITWLMWRHIVLPVSPFTLLGFHIDPSVSDSLYQEVGLSLCILQKVRSTWSVEHRKTIFILFPQSIISLYSDIISFTRNSIIYYIVTNFLFVPSKYIFLRRSFIASVVEWVITWYGTCIHFVGVLLEQEKYT